MVNATQDIRLYCCGHILSVRHPCFDSTERVLRCASDQYYVKVLVWFEVHETRLRRIDQGQVNRSHNARESWERDRSPSGIISSICPYDLFLVLLSISWARFYPISSVLISQASSLTIIWPSTAVDVHSHVLYMRSPASVQFCWIGAETYKLNTIFCTYSACKVVEKPRSYLECR